MLCMIRAPFIGELRADTRWYEVDNLTDEDLPELHVVARCGWDDPSGQDKNELFKVAARRKSELLRELPQSWKPIILWGHGKRGPFTIVEGNNRLVAHAGSTHERQDRERERRMRQVPQAAFHPAVPCNRFTDSRTSYLAARALCPSTAHKWLRMIERASAS
jgi:hypothetical protein